MSGFCGSDTGQLHLFRERLPRRPYCADNLNEGLQIAPASSATGRQHRPRSLTHQVKRWAIDNRDRYLGRHPDDWWVAAVVSRAHSLRNALLAEQRRYPGAGIRVPSLRRTDSLARRLADWVQHVYTGRWSDAMFSRVQAWRGRLGGLASGAVRAARMAPGIARAHQLREQGATQAQIAARLGVSQPTVSRYLRRKNPSSGGSIQEPMTRSRGPQRLFPGPDNGTFTKPCLVPATAPEPVATGGTALFSSEEKNKILATLVGRARFAPAQAASDRRKATIEPRASAVRSIAQVFAGLTAPHKRE